MSAIRPRIVVSKCLEFAHCRYDGEMVASATVRVLKPFVEFVPVCPETAIGLGVPRDPIQVVVHKRKTRLLQPKTGLDLTERIRGFAEAFLSELQDVDGFILKSRSPSCGLEEVTEPPRRQERQANEPPRHREHGEEKMNRIARGRGLFAAAVLRRFPATATEDEGRLLNFTRREHFLTRIFTMARLRAARDARTIPALAAFHARNRLLFMAGNQTVMRELGRIAANLEQRPFPAVLADYEAVLSAALASLPRRTANINVLMHVLGYVENKLAAREKAFFLELLNQYRAGRVPLSTPSSVLRSWVVRFDETYLAAQSYFHPYPEALAALGDSDIMKRKW